MSAIVDKFLARFKTNGNGASGGTVPIINYPPPRGNRPEVTVRYGGMASASWTGRDYEAQVTNGYSKNSDVYSCVSLIAQAAKQAKFDYGNAADKKSADDLIALRKSIGKDVATEQTLFRTKGEYAEYLRKQYNPKPSIELLVKAGGPSFLESWISYLLLGGNDFIEVIRVSGRITMLYLNNPGLVAPVINSDAQHADEAVKSWRITSAYGSGRQRYIDPFPAKQADQAMIHSKLFSPTSDILGLPPLAAAMLSVDTQNEGATLLKRVLQRGYAPGWIEASKDSIWEDTQVAQLRERIKYSKGAGEELFLENAQWHPMGFTPMDSGVTDQQLMTKRDIASVFHVDPALIGDVSTRTYATYAQSRLALYMEAVLPHLRLFRDDWNRTIGAELNSPLDFDKDSFDAITQARSEATDRVHKLWTSGLISQNEARADLEYDPVDGGDIFYLPANMVPMGEAEPEE